MMGLMGNELGLSLVSSPTVNRNTVARCRECALHIVFNVMYDDLRGRVVEPALRKHDNEYNDEH